MLVDAGPWLFRQGASAAGGLPVAVPKLAIGPGAGLQSGLMGARGLGPGVGQAEPGGETAHTPSPISPLSGRRDRLLGVALFPPGGIGAPPRTPCCFRTESSGTWDFPAQGSPQNQPVLGTDSLGLHSPASL